MIADQAAVRAIVQQFLARSDRGMVQIEEETSLYGGGLELDSLEAAELSATLEDEFGTDPFSSGEQLPETVGDILAFYGATSSVA